MPVARAGRAGARFFLAHLFALEALHFRALGPTLPLVGRVGAKRRGGGGAVIRRWTPTPIPSPHGGGEQTEFAARADPTHDNAHYFVARRYEKGPAGGSRRGQVEGGNAQAGDGRTPTIITDRSVTLAPYEGRGGASVKQLTVEGWSRGALQRRCRISDLNEDVDGRTSPR